MENVQEFVEAVRQIFVESARMQVIPPKLAQTWNLPVWRRFQAAADKALHLANEYVRKNIAILKQESAAAEAEVDSKSSPPPPQSGILMDMLRSGDMDEEEVIRIVTDLFLAAADTTSHATQWALYLLARHPTAQDRLREQVRETAASGDALTLAHLADLSYARGVIKEALR